MKVAWNAPAARTWARRAWSGFVLPFHLAGGLLRAGGAGRRLYLRVAVLQAVATFALGSFLYSAPAAAVRAAPAHVDEDARSWARRGRGGVDITVRDDEANGDEAGDEGGKRDENEHPPGFVKAGATFYGALCVAQWIVVGLSHTFRDAIGTAAALAVGLQPEDEPVVPRVRLDIAWTKKRIRRRFRGTIAFASGAPFMAPVMLLGFGAPGAVSALQAVLTTLWGAYWIVVATAARTSLAWDESTRAVPWFLRLWAALQRKVPLFRRWLPRMWGWFLERLTRPLVMPATAVERAPVEITGLAAARVLAGVPCAGAFLAPFVPVAARAVLLGATSAEAPLALGPLR